ncbi:MAG: PH domain-containing protein [Candidatus Pacebacteria bacterium]|nr:PH domain-containing protein [Candidatus Paceibacterota bacterium]MBP9842623.1 PH domain-containing protein [Candidatus Paceibacterota bacterium]
MLFEKLDLEADEEVLRIVRKHWFIIVSELIGVAVFALTPIILLFIGLELPKILGGFDVHAERFTAYITFVIATWLLLSVLSGFVVWTHYYLDLWIITDRRIIAVEQVHFFNRSVAIFRLERLQDIEFSVKGLLQTFFNFGTLSAQTAGHNEANFKSTGMPSPDELQAIIQKAMDARLGELNNRPNLSAAIESSGE